MSLKLINEGIGQEVVNEYNIETAIEDAFREHLNPNLFHNIDYNQKYTSKYGSLKGYVNIPLSEIKDKYPKNFKLTGQILNFNTYPWVCKFKLDIDKVLKQYIDNQLDLNRTSVVFNKCLIFSSYLTVGQSLSYNLKEEDMINKDLFTYLATEVFRRKGFTCVDDSDRYMDSWLQLSKDDINYELSLSEHDNKNNIEIGIFITLDILFTDDNYSIEELKNGRAIIFNLINKQVEKISNGLLEIFDCINSTVDLKNKKTTVSFN